MKKLVLIFSLISFAGVAAEPPLMMVRLRAPHTASDGQWAKTFKVLSENRGACDEVWFSTGIGFPKIEWHRAHVKRLERYAHQLRKAGIMPSLQFQATLGHSDGVTAQEGADGRHGAVLPVAEARSAGTATVRVSLSSSPMCARWRVCMRRSCLGAYGLMTIFELQDTLPLLLGTR